MVEAVFKGAKGQALSDEFENVDYLVDDLLKTKLNSNKKKSIFISGLNAVFRYLNLYDKTIHCKDKEPKECANNLSGAIGALNNVFLVGFQRDLLKCLHQSTASGLWIWIRIISVQMFSVLLLNPRR